MKRLLTFALFALSFAAFAPAAIASRSITSVNVAGAQTPSPLVPGSTAQYGPNAAGSVNVVFGNGTFSGTCTVDLSVTSGLPSGATPTFTPSSVAASGAGTQNSLLTIATTSATAPGTYTFTVAVTQEAGSSCTGSPKTDTATLVIVVPPALTKSFAPTSVGVGVNSVLSLTISNGNPATMTGAGVVDSLPTNMKVASPLANVTNSCTGTWSPTVNATSVTLSAESVPANGSCTVTVAVTTTASGSFVNTTNAPTSTADGTGTAATATLTVVGVASKLAFTTSPSNQTAGVAFGTQPVVALEDASGNIVTGTAQNVQLTIQNNVGSGTLSGTTTVAVNTSTGLATFSGLSINKSGTGYTLTAAGSTVNTSPGTIISGSFNITAGTATQLVYTTPPSTPNNGGTAFGTQPVVSIEDSLGNVVTTATNSITLAIGTNPVGGTLTCTSSNPLPAIAGVATFVGCKIDKASAGYTLTASATSLSSANSGSITIQVGPAAKLAFGVSPSNAQAGATITPAVTVLIQDLGGNLTTSTATVALAISGGTLNGGGGVPAVNGTATFSALSATKTGTFTLLATSAGLTSATSGSFTITPGPATQLAFTTNPSNSTGGVAFATQPQVTLEDANNNTVTGTAQTVTVAIQNNAGPGGAGVLSGTATATLNTGTGIATFTGLSINLAGTGYTLTATGSTVSLTAGVVLSGSFNISVGPANKLAFTVSPSNGTGGVAFPTQPVVALEDAGGNIVTGTGQTVTASIQNNAGSGTLAGTTAATLNTGTGLATFTNLSINKIGNGYTLTVKGSTVNTSPGTIISSPFNITAGTATQMVFGQQPTTTQSAATMAPPVTVLFNDAGGNLTASTASVTVAFGTNTVGGTLSGTLTQSAVAGTASFGDLSVNKTAANYTLTATSTGLTTITSNAFTITAGTATQLVFTTSPSNSTGGVAFGTQPVVKVEDANNNVVTSGTNSNASITLAIGTNAGPGGTLTCTTNPQTATAGSDTFAGCKIDVAGNGYTLTAAAAGLTGATSGTFNITVGTAAKLQIGVQPSSTVDTVAISPAVTVNILDAGGNQTTSTASVTFAIGTNPGGAGTVLSGGGATAAVNGTATFGNLSINKIGTGYTLVASSGALTTATTSPFNITIGTATKLGFSVQPVNTNNHATITPAVVVQVQDAGGNLVSTATDSITMAIGTNAGPGGVLSGTLVQPTSGGAATFNDLSIDLVGSNYTLTANDGGTFTAATSATFNITPGPATQLIFTTQPSATAAPGTAFAIQPVVKVEDANGNVMTTGTGSAASITLAIGFNAGPGGVLSCTTDPVTATAGVATFAGCKINLVGNGYTLAASTTGGINGATSTPINITLGNIKQVGEQLTGNCHVTTGNCTIALNATALTSSNNMLLVGISNASTATVTGVTWNGSALAIVPTCSATGTQSNSAHFEIWFLANPALVSSNVIVSFGSTQTVEAGAAIFSNVSSLGTCVKTSGQSGSTSATLSPVVAAGGAAFDTFTENTIGTATITNPSAPQVSLWNISAGASAGSGSYALAPITTMTRSWNTATSVFAYGAVPLNPTMAAGKHGQVIIGSLFEQETPNPTIFHLGDSSRTTSTDRDANPSAIISKRD